MLQLCLIYSCHPQPPSPTPGACLPMLNLVPKLSFQEDLRFLWEVANSWARTMRMKAHKEHSPPPLLPRSNSTMPCKEESLEDGKERHLEKEPVGCRVSFSGGSDCFSTCVNWNHYQCSGCLGGVETAMAASSFTIKEGMMNSPQRQIE